MSQTHKGAREGRGEGSWTILHPPQRRELAGWLLFLILFSFLINVASTFILFSPPPSPCSSSVWSVRKPNYLRICIHTAVIWILVYPKTFPVGFKKHNSPQFLHEDCKNGKWVQTFSSSTANLCTAKNIIDYDPSCLAMSQQATDFRMDPEYRSNTQKMYNVWAKCFLCGPGK